MSAHPEDSKSWHEEFVKQLSGETHVMKVTVKMDGMEKPTTWLSKAPMIANMLCELHVAVIIRSAGPVENTLLGEIDDSWCLG